MTKIYSKLNIVVLFSKISNDKNDSKLKILRILLKSQNYKITSMKTRLVEGFSVSWVLYKNNHFLWQIFATCWPKKKEQCKFYKGFFWKKMKKRPNVIIFFKEKKSRDSTSNAKWV
jgi:hypothetical protein